jgi:putative methyltransferase (TIGR04325 family)
MGKWKKVIKDIFPPVLLRILTGFFYGWHGNFSRWEEALVESSGYDSDVILEKVKASALKVKIGSSAYERDSVLFEKTEYSFPLLSGLMWIAARNKGKLNVMDFGGSLGSSYFQNRLFLDSISEVNWCIVEQPGFVKAGIEYFEDEKLHFFYSIDECMNSYDIDVIILSSVLQYIEKPFVLLDQIMSAGFKYILIDRTPFINRNDRITLQKVHPGIYKGSYPCWFFNKDRFINRINNYYKLVIEFDALDEANIRSEFKGFIFQKKEL